MRLNSILIAFLILVSSTLIFAMSTDSVRGITPDDGVDGVQYLQGTWAIINFPEEYTNETIILTGNLTSYNHLTLTNTAIKMNSSLAKKYNIIFYISSNLTLKKNSMITANNSLNPYDLVFNTGSKAYIEESTISYAGYAGGLSEGILIKSNTVTFNNSIITNNYNGIVCFSVSPKIYNSVITNSVNKDMVLKGNSHPVIINTKLDKSKVEVLDTSSLALNWYLSIKVNNLTDATPLEGVKVTIKNATGEHFSTLITDKKGMVDTQVLPEVVIHPGNKIDKHSPFSITVEKENFKTLVFDNVELTKSKSVIYNLTLRPLAGSIEGNVTDDSGDPVTGAKVSVTKGPLEIGSAFSDSAGHYVLLDVPANTGYTVTASNAPKYESDVETGIVVTPKNVTEVDFEIVLRQLPVSSVPMDGDENVPVNAILAVTFEEVMNTSSVESNIDIIENSTGVIVAGSWVTTDNKEFQFTPDERLESESQYLIRVFSFVKNLTNGRPLWDDFEVSFMTEYSPPAVIQVSPSGTDVAKNANIFIAFDHSMNRTSVENAITINPAGTSVFQWSTYQGNADAIVTIIYDLRGGLTYNISIDTTAFSKQNKFLAAANSWEFTTKSDLGSLTGRIIDENGNPISGVRISVEDAGVEAVKTDSNGYYTIEGVREGSYTVNISKSGFGSLEEVILISPGVNDRGPVKLVKSASSGDEKDEEMDSELLLASGIIILLIIIILVFVVLISLAERKDQPALQQEERVDYIEPYSYSGDESMGENEVALGPGSPEYRGRCPVCKHAVYGDYGCFHCAAGGGERY